MTREYEARDRHLKGLGFSSYKDYLSSSLWKRLRAEAWKRASGRCEACGEPGRDVHHRSYSPSVLAGDSNPLVLLCRECHRRAEFTDEGKKVRMHTANKRISKMAAANGLNLKSSCSTPGCNYMRSRTSTLCGYCRALP